MTLYAIVRVGVRLAVKNLRIRVLQFLCAGLRMSAVQVGVVLLIRPECASSYLQRTMTSKSNSTPFLTRRVLSLMWVLRFKIAIQNLERMILKVG